MKLQKRTKLEKFLEGFQDTLWAIECRFDPEYDSIDIERDKGGRELFMDAINVGWWEINYGEEITRYCISYMNFTNQNAND